MRATGVPWVGSLSRGQARRQCDGEQRTPGTRATLCVGHSTSKTVKSTLLIAISFVTRRSFCYMTTIRVIQRCTRGRFAPTPALWNASSSYRPVRAMAFRMCSKCCQLFRAFRARALFVRGVMHPYFSVGPSRQSEAQCGCPGGLALLESHGASTPW